MYELASPLGRPLNQFEFRLPHITLLHKVLADIQEGRYCNWQKKWKMYKDVREEVAVHQLRQEIRWLYREVGVDISSTDLMPRLHCVAPVQQEQHNAVALTRDNEVHRSGAFSSLDAPTPPPLP